MRDVATAIQQIKDVGYTIIPKLIFGARLKRAQADAEALLEATPIEMPGLDDKVFGRMCKGLFGKSRAFDDLYAHPWFLPSFAACWSTLTESEAATSSAAVSSSRRS